MTRIRRAVAVAVVQAKKSERTNLSGANSLSPGFGLNVPFVPLPGKPKLKPRREGVL